MFLVLALPRSRTFWLSQFLSHGGWQCGHDQLRYCRSFDDVRSWLAQPRTGTVETVGAPFWRLIPRLAPDVRLVTIRRPVVEVVDSWARTGLRFDVTKMTKVMQQVDRKLDQLEYRLAGVQRFDYDELAEESVCARLFEHCLQLPHDHGWWRHLSAMNLQINLDHLWRYCDAHKSQLAKMALTAKHVALAAMQPVEDHVEDGVTFQQETFRRSFADATELMTKHMVATEQSPDDFLRKNVPLMEALDDLGRMQVTTARCNGRMFGYLMSIIAPSLDAPDRIVAQPTAFFAESSIKNLGMRLQRASLQALKRRGVHEVLFRAGHRGAGPRLGTFYRRLGAVEFGQLYRLELEA